KMKKDYLLSVTTEKDGDIVYIHADKNGLEFLENTIRRLRANLEKDECDHDHLFTEAWAGDELTETMIEKEKQDNCNQVHHVKIYSWTDVWAKKHKIKDYNNK
ncbi:MAG: hypothetical protein GY699_21800, partial [Desulfobacteraceae bacterium]|nr:hypothetical protein [Desulfobacteraceae bacterium]